ncbi:MAG: hypothetical protein ACK4WH_03725 [Phycisphaerales bacterium]
MNGGSRFGEATGQGERPRHAPGRDAPPKQASLFGLFAPVDTRDA